MIELYDLFLHSEYGHQVKDVSHLSEMVAGGFSQVIFVGEKKQSIYSGRYVSL